MRRDNHHVIHFGSYQLDCGIYRSVDSSGEFCFGLCTFMVMIMKDGDGDSGDGWSVDDECSGLRADVVGSGNVF